MIWNAIEERQMQLAVQASESDLLRKTREEQDKEFERLETQQKEMEKTLHTSVISEPNLKKRDQVDTSIGKKISFSDLDSIVDEEPKSNESVLMRIRLPNGARSQRRFHYSHTIQETRSWIDHELLKNNLHELIFNFRLISTMPRTVYGEGTKGSEETLKEVGFWRNSSKRESQSPILYVEVDEANDTD